jgi:hypothetical protein
MVNEILTLSSAIGDGFEQDISAGNVWKSASRSFSGYSVEQIVVAAANGFRHEDE